MNDTLDEPGAPHAAKRQGWTTQTLTRSPFGPLVYVDREGQRHEGVLPVRAFPLAASREHLALVGTDGHELLWIQRLDDLPEPVGRLIEEELAQREVTPVIQRIVSVSTFSTPSQWIVETDRGRTQLLLKGEEDIRRLPEPGRLLVTDGHGIPYLVHDRFALDRHSRRILERFL